MSAPETSFGPPRGMRDFYPEDMAVRNVIFDAWTASARRFGFAHYDSCVVESLDLLKRKKPGEEIIDQIYAFADKSGRELALRPEMTPTLARMVAAKIGSLTLPVKWFAIAQCFRYERMTRGRKREHYQWNLDIIGEESVTAEAEVIATAVHALHAMGLKPGEFFVHFSNRALLSELLLKLGIPAEAHALTFLALDKRGKITDDEIKKLLTDGGLASDLVASIFSMLSISSIEEARRIAGDDSPACRRILELIRLMELHGLPGAIRFDIAVVRGLSYYTGIVFEAFDANRKLRAIFGGGRYDNLLNDIGGTPATAVGLGFGDVVIAELLADLGRLQAQMPLSGMAVGYMDEAQRDTAIKVAAALRRQGRSVDLSLKPEKPKNFFGKAGKAREEAIYVGPDDIAKGSVRIKNLLTRAEQEVPLATILE